MYKISYKIRKGCDYMKIERINDKQIRCTLSKKDLAERQLKLSELAYGSDKAKALFREMMQQASYEVGFEAEDIPLMIEAIPMAGECLVLIVTKVDDPEELDTRFSKFSKSLDINSDEDEDDDDDSNPTAIDLSQKEDILNCFEKLTDMISKAGELKKSIAKADKTTKGSEAPEQTAKEEPAVPHYRLYLFNSLETVIQTTAIVRPYYKGESDLYKSPDINRYFLLLKPSASNADVFNRVCGIMSEYGIPEKTTYATKEFINEHLTPVIIGDAITKLAKL